jgi:putative tricarboxylic transport membrane protein
VKVNDAIVGALLLAFGLAVVAWSWRFPAIPGQAYGAATFPVLIGAGLAGLSLVMIARGAAGWRIVPGVVLSGWGRSARSWFNVGLTTLAIVAYILVSDALGFVPTSFLILLVLFLALGVRWVTAVLAAALATLLIQQAFGVLLRVPLPRSDLLAGLW